MVAARAGVSIATVSRVMSGSPRVLPKTAAQVQRAIEELNFIPSASATTLKYGRSETFGVIIADIVNPFFLEFIRDFEALLVSKQHGILLANTDQKDRVESSVIRMLKSQVNGVVIMPSDEEFSPYNRLALRNIPVVTFDRRIVQPLVSDISYRFDLGMFQAIAHLHELGHRHIALIGGIENLDTSTMRAEAFFSAMRHFEIPPRPEWFVNGDYRMESGYEKMRQLMSLPSRPTAVIAVNDMMALGALRAAHVLKISVPRHVSIVGSDDIALADIVTPALTTIQLPRKTIAQACIKAFAHMTEKPKSDGLQIFIETKLIVRQSTAKPPASAPKKARK
jgi:LacI family transcriptional regulator